MKINTTYPLETPLDVVPTLAQNTDKAGFDGLWLPEGGHNSVTALTTAASAADRLDL